VTWRDRAACRGTDPETFFPISEHPTHHNLATQAKAICHTCPVTAECLEFALTHRCDYGVWGGLTGHERDRAIGRTRGATSRPAPPIDPHQIHEVAALTRAGLSVKAIARRLGMHPRVVVRYRALSRNGIAS
jgi:WhiB family transcriptional regulator, redox-sensing transcriptional regulator